MTTHSYIKFTFYFIASTMAYIFINIEFGIFILLSAILYEIMTRNSDITQE